MRSKVGRLTNELNNLRHSRDFLDWMTILNDNKDFDMRFVITHITSGYCGDLAVFLALKYGVQIIYSKLGHFFVGHRNSKQLLYFDGRTPNGVESISELAYFKDGSFEGLDIVGSCAFPSGMSVWEVWLQSAREALKANRPYVSYSTLLTLELMKSTSAQRANELFKKMFFSHNGDSDE